jgi:glycerophosphoryl diester phosphodiesterase
MLNTPDELSRQQSDSYEEFAESVCQEAGEGGYAGLNMSAATCRRQAVERAHAAGLLVWVYTVNGRLDMERFVEMGVDAITTRRPGNLIQLLKNEKK